MGVPQNGCFTRENPIEMDDLGEPPFITPIYGNPQIWKVKPLFCREFCFSLPCQERKDTNTQFEVQRPRRTRKLPQVAELRKSATVVSGAYSNLQKKER